MATTEFTILVAGGSFLAGLLGALTGLGGGVIIVPLLALAFGVDIRYAIGASLVSVIATSSGAAAAYLKEGYSNMRVGMFLEIATTIGAVCGAYLATRIPTAAIAIISASCCSTPRGHPSPSLRNWPRRTRVPSRDSCGWTATIPRPKATARITSPAFRRDSA